IQDPKRRRRHREEVNGRDIAEMIVQENPPTLRRRFGSTNQVFGHRRLGNLKTELEQLAMDAWRTPANIRCLHVSNELSKLPVDTRSSDMTTLPCPMPSTTFPMPSDDRVGMQRLEHLSPTDDIAGKGYPKEAITPRDGQARFERCLNIASC
ncbi:MAG: hypothetical protein AAF497_19760, partial [Planctomycetota bacterium]